MVDVKVTFFFPDTPIKSINISAFEIEKIGMTFVFLKIRELIYGRHANL